MVIDRESKINDLKKEIMDHSLLSTARQSAINGARISSLDNELKWLNQLIHTITKVEESI
jgi:hypothetical protein